MARVFTTRKFCARYTQRLSTPYRTRKNVTKPHALHANRHWNLFEKCRFLQNQFFHTNFPMNLKICYIKIDVSSDEACCACRATFWGRFIKCGPCHEKRDSLVESDAKSIALVRQNDFRYVVKHVGMSQTTTPATPTEATGHLKFLRVTTFRPYEALTRTVANSCERLRTVADGCGRRCNVQRTHLWPPAQTPGVKWEALLHIRQGWCCRTFSPIGTWSVVKLYSSGQGSRAPVPGTGRPIKKWKPKNIFSMRCGSYMIYDLREVRDW